MSFRLDGWTYRSLSRSKQIAIHLLSCCVLYIPKKVKHNKDRINKQWYILHITLYTYTTLGVIITPRRTACY